MGLQDLPPNSFLIIDYLAPIFKTEFDKEELKYIEIHTDEYNDEVFVFDCREVRIKYFNEIKTKIKTGKTIKNVSTTRIVFSDDSELLVRAEIKELFIDFIPDYLNKLNAYYPNEVPTVLTEQ